MKRYARIARLLLVTGVAMVGLAGFTTGPAAGSTSSPAYSAPKPDGESGILVVGGRQATENYSFLAYTGGCTGTLIKANWVVTARHCPTPATVRIGSINRNSGGTVARVTRGVNSPFNDVKLLQLATSVGHAPAAIPTTSGANGTATRIIGWGLACPVRGCGSTPVVARELDTSIVADSRCRGIDGPREICTNNPGGDAGACYGDSGGPQVRRVGARWVVIGATSRSGNGSPVCGSGPSIYGDLPSIRSWISGIVGGLPA